MLALVADALAAKRINLAGQDAYRLSDHRALHTEIMARLRDPSGREFVAAEFLPAVAAQGLGEQLDRVVIEQGAGSARGARRRDQHQRFDPLARAGELHAVAAAAPAARAALAARLVFEMAENAVVQNEAAAAAFARALAGAGAGFALDNFGIRRDSLALAQRLRPGVHQACRRAHRQPC